MRTADFQRSSLALFSCLVFSDVGFGCLIRTVGSTESYGMLLKYRQLPSFDRDCFSETSLKELVKRSIW